MLDPKLSDKGHRKGISDAHSSPQPMHMRMHALLPPPNTITHTRGPQVSLLTGCAAISALAVMCAHAGGRVVASPYARKLASEAGVDVGRAKGTGPGGRIVAADVQQLIESGGGEAEAGAPAAPEAATAAHEVCGTCWPLSGMCVQ